MQAGGLDAFYFMYGEDLELGLRLFLIGWDILYSPKSVVYHNYAFRESARKYFLLERNRLFTLMKLYRPQTLLAMLPVILLSEFGVLTKAASEGWLSSKLASYVSVLVNIRHLLAARLETQRKRVRSDSDLIRILRGGLGFSETGKSRPIEIGNRILDKYRQFLLRLRL